MKQMARMAVPSSHSMAATMMAMVIRKERTDRAWTGEYVAGRTVSAQPCQSTYSKSGYRYYSEERLLPISPGATFYSPGSPEGE